jgi:6-phosphogluconolactonase (cycloisomerase 2 family)
MNNEASGNVIVKLARDTNGVLTRVGEYSTGGLGSGPGPLPVAFGGPGPGPLPLESQDSLISAHEGHYLLAVNAGSNDISVMAVRRDGLVVTDRGSSGGIYPVSIAYREGLVYVINLGGVPTLESSPGTPTMTGFFLSDEGKLEPIPGSTRVIGDFASSPADVVFSPDGRFLVVTERITNLIDVFPMLEDGRTGDKVVSHSSNLDPFGMEFTRNGVLVVTEGVDASPHVPKPNASSTSSYRVRDNGTLETISAAVPTEQSAACWVRFSKNQKQAYVVNSGSATISTYDISPRGKLTLAIKVAGDTGQFGAAIDESVTPDGKFLYVDSPLIGSLRGFRIEKDGSLTPVTHVEGFPVSFSGIVAF